MTRQSPRRSPRQVAKAMAYSGSIDEGAIPSTSTSTSTSRRSSMSQEGRCSLQSLDDRSVSPPRGLMTIETDDVGTDDTNEIQSHMWPAKRVSTIRRLTPKPAASIPTTDFPVVPTREPSPKPVASIPTDFPVGDTVMVVQTHARHRGRTGTVRRHTAKFVVVAFDDDIDTNEGIRISPNFLTRTPRRDVPGARSLASRPSVYGRPDVTSPLFPPVDFKRVSAVRFDLGRNSMAKYDREAPPSIVSERTYSLERTDPNIVEHMPDEIDDVTLRNEEILAEWDDHFDEDYKFDERYNNVFFRLVSL